MKKLLINLCVLPCLVISTAWAEMAEVVIVKGKSVTYAGKSISSGQKIETGALLKTGARSFVKILIKESKSFISVGPKSQVEIKEIEKSSQSKSKITLLAGALRFKGIEGESGKEKPTLYTRNASMGIRGTDFLLKANPVLGESEIVLFTGLVQMTNLEDESNSEKIAPGQWGGIGGRFGPKVQKPIQLPSKALNGFNKLLDW